MATTNRTLHKLSSPACSPRYMMTIPAGTECTKVDGRWVVADTSKVVGSDSHDLEHYYIWLDADEVTA